MLKVHIVDSTVLCSLRSQLPKKEKGPGAKTRGREESDEKTVSYQELNPGPLKESTYYVY